MISPSTDSQCTDHVNQHIDDERLKYIRLRTDEESRLIECT